MPPGPLPTSPLTPNRMAPIYFCRASIYKAGRRERCHLKIESHHGVDEELVCESQGDFCFLLFPFLLLCTPLPPATPAYRLRGLWGTSQRQGSRSWGSACSV